MRKSLALLAGMAFMASVAPAMATGHTKESVDYRKGIRPSVTKKSVLHGTGDANPWKHTRTPKFNQRQYRKWLRQNNNMRKSKKVK